MTQWNSVPTDAVIERTVAALRTHNIEAIVVENGEEAKKKALELMPKHAEVMDMTSVTLASLGIAKHIQESGHYDSVKKKLADMDRKTHGKEMQKHGAAPEWAIGSVHAVTEDGDVIIASNTGSQLPAYAYGSSHVLWIVGAQKIVKNVDEGMKRIYEHTLPLESERARKAYGVEGSFVSKVLIFHREPQPGRITMIIVKEAIGF
jgi:hypothetical protein